MPHTFFTKSQIYSFNVFLADKRTQRTVITLLEIGWDPCDEADEAYKFALLFTIAKNLTSQFDLQLLCLFFALLKERFLESYCWMYTCLLLKG